MSMNTKQSDLGDQNRVVISTEDCQECMKFFEFFEIPISPELKTALEGFIANPTFMNQNELKFRLAEIISTSSHPIFQDEVFAMVRPETREVHEALAFERALEAQLTSTDEQ